MAEQERAIKTRQAVLLAAATVFDERGYDATNVAEILTRAGVTKGAMYFHFPSKEALAEAVMAEQARGLPDPVPDAPVQTVVNLTRHVAHELQTNPLVRAGVRLALDQGSFRTRSTPAYLRWIDIVERHLREAATLGHLLPHVVPRETAEFVVGAFTGVQLLSQELTGRADLQQRVTALWRYLLPTIVPPTLLLHLRLDEPTPAPVV